MLENTLFSIDGIREYNCPVVAFKRVAVLTVASDSSVSNNYAYNKRLYLYAKALKCVTFWRRSHLRGND